MKTRISVTKNFSSYFLAIVCIVLFFSYEYVPKYSDAYTKAIAKHKKDVNKVSSALKIITKKAEGTIEYTNYKKLEDQKNKSKKRYLLLKKEERFFNFKSIKFFLYEFGGNFCWFCFLIYILFRSFYFERKNIGIKALYCVMMSFVIFKFFWIFQQFQDLSKASYYFITLFTSALIITATWLITRYRNNYINHLKQINLELSIHALKHTVPNKQQDILNRLEQISKELNEINGK